MTPILFRWQGDGFVPASSHWAKMADREYVVGELYRMAPVEERSSATHNHFFALVSEAWKNLPEELLAEFPSSEHLRKKLLVKTGYADERSIVCASKAEAQRVAAFIRPMDEYAVVIVREAVVRVYTAQSQSNRAMGKHAFQASKEAVLNALADLLGVEPGELARAA